MHHGSRLTFALRGRARIGRLAGVLAVPLTIGSTALAAGAVAPSTPTSPTTPRVTNPTSPTTPAATTTKPALPAATTPATTPVPTPPVPQRFGVNDLRGWWLGSPNLPVGYPVAAHRALATRDLTDMAAHKLIYRVTMPMTEMDTNADGTIDAWRFPDAMFTTAAQRGVTLHVVLTNPSALTPTTPAARSAFALGAKAFATRYRAGGNFWLQNPTLAARPLTTIELWNEPNQTGYFNGTAQDYGKLLGRVWQQTNSLLGGFQLVSGGVSEVSANGSRGGVWLALALAAADDELTTAYANPYFALQGVALHAYGTGTYSVNKAMINTRQFITDLNAYSVPLGYSVPPVWITEFGWKYSAVTDAANHSYSESELLTRYSSLVTQWIGMGSAIGPMFAYNYRMGGTTGNIDDGFGWNSTVGTLFGDDTTQAQSGVQRSYGTWFEDKAVTYPN